jgi:hypothetical protein
VELRCVEVCVAAVFESLRRSTRRPAACRRLARSGEIIRHMAPAGQQTGTASQGAPGTPAEPARQRRPEGFQRVGAGAADDTAGRRRRAPGSEVPQRRASQAAVAGRGRGASRAGAVTPNPGLSGRSVQRWPRTAPKTCSALAPREEEEATGAPGQMAHGESESEARAMLRAQEHGLPAHGHSFTCLL